MKRPIYTLLSCAAFDVFAPCAVFAGLVCMATVGISGCQSPEKGGVTSQADTAYTLTGTITGVDTGWVYLLHRQATDHHIDSTRIDKGRFHFTGRAAEPELCYVGLGEGGNKEFHVSLFIQNGDLHLSTNKDSLTDGKVTVTGSPAETELQRFELSQAPIDSAQHANQNLYGAAYHKHDQHAMDSLTTVFGQLSERRKISVKAFVRSNPSSVVAAYETYDNFAYDPDPDLLDSLYKTMDSTVDRSWYGLKLHDLIAKARATGVGQQAPDFTQNDSKGNPITLSSFRGKLTLVDFWASWCGPCRAENPNVVKAYRKYHPKGFAILGVSLDEKAEPWEAAIKKDKLAWTQVSDLKGWQNAVAVQYDVNSIPINYLLDKDGKIIARGLRGKELDEKLAALTSPQK